MKSFFALLLMLPLLAGHHLLAQDGGAAPFPQTERPKFQVADLHGSKTAANFTGIPGGVLRDGLYTNRDATLLELIEAAYGVQEDAIAGGPGWISSDLFDVIAKVPEGTTIPTANLMLQGLLEERFGLVVRNETRPVPRYALTVGRGSKLRRASGSGDSGCRFKGQPAPANTMDASLLPNNKISCQWMSAADLAKNLHSMASGYLDHDVVDSTKLDGLWDFDLEWTPFRAFAAKGRDGISIFNAVDKQLGLKLQLQNVPMPSLAIIQVNRKPSPNPSGVASALALPAARFEVAVIKPADPNGHPFTGIYFSGGSEVRAGGTLRDLLALTLELPPNVIADSVVGLPKSATTQMWDIAAKLPMTGEGSPHSVNGRLQLPQISVLLEMLRGLLADQFELKTHTENREVTVYAMTVVGKAKIARAGESERSGCDWEPNAPRPMPTAQSLIRCKNASMSDFEQFLQHGAGAYIDHPIVDATGLEGGWDFLIGWTPKAMLQPAQSSGANAPGGATVEASAPDGITLFEALERQLGLKLVKEKRSIPVVVVDHVDETPLN